MLLQVIVVGIVSEVVDAEIIAVNIYNDRAVRLRGDIGNPAGKRVDQGVPQKRVSAASEQIVISSRA